MRGSRVKMEGNVRGCKDVALTASTRQAEDHLSSVEGTQRTCVFLSRVNAAENSNGRVANEDAGGWATWDVDVGAECRYWLTGGA